jgi:hypothetical protein
MRVVAEWQGRRQSPKRNDGIVVNCRAAFAYQAPSMSVGIISVYFRHNVL